MNELAALLSNVDALGKDFTAATYGAISAHMTPVASGLFVLYLIFWGFRFWQGTGDTNIVAISFKLLRIAMIFAMATQWGQIQIAIYQGVTNIPYMISGVMLNNIVNPRNGKAMGMATVARDISTIYEYALIAAVKIENNVAKAAVPVPPPDNGGAPAPQPQKTAPPTNATKEALLAAPLQSPLSAAIVWIAAAIFAGYALALLLFAKLALWVMLALAPLAIISLIFQAPSRFFWGWLSGLVQAMLIPVFLSTFLSFYLLGAQDGIFALINSVNATNSPAMKDVAPFVAICMAGFFLLTRIFPFTARIAAGTQGWVEGQSTRMGWASAHRAGEQFPSGRGARSRSAGSATSYSGSHASSYAGTETAMRDLQDRNASITRQGKNR
ncbi:type IV secretion system protein [Phyllobacterium sp. 21LDTY02-6]|uniref:type IV secretion system protein n=1 Tax=Phyllobacterium sp. 21LDTY02-6 TaxID=2944903 RepID=UPI00202182FB|nr:type IV secretion system protein [Phyllobacterium sp. 21LDTY02-6]MCO4317973.1 type IV secretion system protein [Phyllobacterium sp. 21LDTY02-6]